MCGLGRAGLPRIRKHVGVGSGTRATLHLNRRPELATT
jgi:hypothetical protein